MHRLPRNEGMMTCHQNPGPGDHQLSWKHIQNKNRNSSVKVRREIDVKYCKRKQIKFKSAIENFPSTSLPVYWIHRYKSVSEINIFWSLWGTESKFEFLALENKFRTRLPTNFRIRFKSCNLLRCLFTHCQFTTLHFFPTEDWVTRKFWKVL